MKVLTSFTAHTTAEGQRISYTYSVIDEEGNIINQNIRENFVVVDAGLQSHIKAISDYINANKLEG